MKLLESHSFAGCQFPGRKGISEVVQEIERQRKARKDFIVNSSKLEMKVIDDQMLLEVPAPGERLLLPATRGVFSRIAQDMGIRQTDRFYKWLTLGTQANKASERHDIRKNWKVWAGLINDYWRTEKEGKLVRVMEKPKEGPYCRALLTDKYKIIDNADFFFNIADRCMDMKAQIVHARLSEDTFYGYAMAEGISGQVSLDRTFDPGDGWQSRWYGEEGDVCNAAMAFGNSETGAGGCFLKKAILRRICQNYNIWHDVVAKTHIGRRMELDTVLTAETLQKQNEVFFLEIKDHVASVFDPVKFQEMIDVMNNATRDEVREAEVAVEAINLCFDLGETRKNILREHFLRNLDNSRFGLANAITQMAHHDSIDADKGFELECVGTEVLNTSMLALIGRADVLAKSKAKKKEDATVGV